MGQDKKIKKRREILGQYKWHIEEMYASETLWEDDFLKVKTAAELFTGFSGHLADSSSKLYEALHEKDEIFRLCEKIYVYARMKKDEDNRVDLYQSMCDRAQGLIAETSAFLSFFVPELLEMQEDVLKRFMSENEGIKVYSHLINDLIRQKDHVLSKNEENIMAQISELTSATNSIFSMINNADIKFGSIIDEDGDEVELTHGRYIGFMESDNREVRKAAFSKMYGAFERQKNTLATTYNYNTKTDVVMARIRKYESSIQASLDGDCIPLTVYDNLVSTVNGRLDLLHRYVEVRRHLLKIDDVHMYDMYTPLVPSSNKKVDYKSALDIIRRGLAPLGEAYIDQMNKGLTSGWIDVYENEGKTSGAYSFGSYDSLPYILLNYNNKLKDVFTVAHEMGHSMHSFYTRSNQPYVYGGHSIFTAEVASTVNEVLLMQHLLANAKNKEEKLYLLNLYIEEFRTTLFRQTMFAEFEKLTHEEISKGGVLTQDWLCERYSALNRKYFGDKVIYGPEISMEWARIPHFYNAFYVYKYATGYSAAVALSDKILNEGSAARDNYIEFLKSGDSDYPVELLKKAGVDMMGPEAIMKALDTFENLIVEIEKIV